MKPEVLRIDFLPSRVSTIPASLSVLRDTMDASAISVSESTDFYQFSAGKTSVRVNRAGNMRLEILNANGRTLLKEPESGGLSINGSTKSAGFSPVPEGFWGSGSRATAFNLRGQFLDLYNTQTFGYSTALANMNLNVPFLTSSGGFGLFVDGTSRQRYELRLTDQFRFSVVTGELSFYVFEGETTAQQLELYTWLTGRSSLLPKWSYGYIQSRYGYRSEAEARATVATFQEKRIPLHGIVLDLYWYRQMGDFAWDASMWPNPAGMISDFRQLGVETIPISQPYFTSRSLNWGNLFYAGFAAKKADGGAYVIPNWWSCNCDVTLLDITLPSAVTKMKTWYEPLFGRDGIRAVWTDLGEPENHPTSMMHFAGTASEIHNGYNLRWAKAVSEQFAAQHSGKRLFNLTRSGWAGVQRFGTSTWSGDVSTSWSGLALQLPLMLSASMSGISWHHSDIGGFCCGATSPELYIRWMQLGAYAPVMRAHGVDYQGQEPWSYGTDAEEIATALIRRRTELLPYIYSEAYKSSQTGEPFVKPLFYGNESRTDLWHITKGYYFGKDMLVFPVVQSGSRRAEILLPEGTWLRESNGELMAAQQGFVEAPLESIPVFVRANTLIPSQPWTTSSQEVISDTLMLDVFAAVIAGSSETVLVEDDGISTLTNTSVVKSRFQFDQKSNSEMDITWRGAEGKTALLPEKRTFVIRFRHEKRPVLAASIAGVVLSEKTGPEDGWRKTSAGLEFYVTRNSAFTGQLSVQFQTGTASEKNVLPLQTELLPAFPNPFNPSTSVHFRLKKAGKVRLVVFDALGRPVSELVNRSFSAGSHAVSWKAGGLASGVYRVVMEADGKTFTQSITLVK